jgi:hypothetical protein
VRGLETYDVLFFTHLATSRDHVTGVTPHPVEHWMMHVARHVTLAD